MSVLFDDIVQILTEEQKEPEWLIPDLLLEGSLLALAGEPAAGKSYLSYTLGLAVASGCSALSGLIPAGEPRRVIYFDQENGKQDRDRYLTRSWHGLMQKGIAPDLGRLQANFFPVHFALGQEDWADIVTEYVDELNPALMVFDTTTPCFDLEDENSNAEATKAINELRAIMKRTDPVCASIALKHARIISDKGGRRTMRGAKAWEGAVDGILYMVKAVGRPMKSGLNRTRLEPGKVRAYGLRDTIFITPRWTDEDRTGLVLEGSYKADKDHQIAQMKEDPDNDE